MLCSFAATPALAESTIVQGSVTVAGEGAAQVFDGPRSISVSGGLNLVELTAKDKRRRLLFQFAPPSGKQLEVGEYNGAQRYPYEPGGYPGLTVAPNGVLCSTDYGRFVVKDIHVDSAGKLERFWALYEQHCNGPTAPPLFGEVRIGEPTQTAPRAVPTAIDWPSALVGERGLEVPVTVIGGEAGAEVKSVALEGEDAADFSVMGNGCAGKHLRRPRASCEVLLDATPRADGARAAKLVVSEKSGATATVSLAVEAGLQINSATAVSEPGDFVGDGVDRLFDEPGAVVLTGGPSRVEVWAQNSSEWFSFHFTAPRGGQLQPGEYVNATRPSFGPEGAPGLEVGGGRGCNESIGRFIVKDIHTNASGNVDRFWALYEQHCGTAEAPAPALFGEVRFGEPPTGAPEAVEPAAIQWPNTIVGKSALQVPVTVMDGEAGAEVASVAVAGEDAGDFSVSSDGCIGTYLEPGVTCSLDVAVKPSAIGGRSAQLVITDTDGEKTSVPLAVTAIAPEPPTENWATMVSEGGNFVGSGYGGANVDRLFDASGAVSVHDGLGYLEVSVKKGSESFSLNFTPPAGESLEDGEYAGARSSQSPGEPGLDVSGDGRGCDRQYGRFVIRDIHMNAAGKVDRLSLLYEQHCENANGPALFGEVRFGEPIPASPETAEPAAIDWPATPIGASGAQVPVTIVAQEAGAHVTAVSIEGEDADDFDVAINGCSEATLAPGARCEVAVGVRPTAAGLRTAQMVITDSSGTTTSVPLAVNDVPKPQPLSDNSATIAGEGGNHLFDEPDAVTVRGDLTHVEVALAEHGESFTLNLAAPAGQSLEDREYAEAGGYPFQAPGEAGVSLSGQCSQSGGRFIVKDIHTDAAGDVDRLWALYEQDCEPDGRATFGEVRYGEEPTTAPEAVEPAAIDWPSTAAGASGYTVPVTMIAHEGGADIGSVAIEGPSAEDFRVSNDGCTGEELSTGARCELDVEVTPTSTEPVTAQLVVTDRSGAMTRVPLGVNNPEQRPPPALSPDWATLVAERGNWIARKTGDRIFDTPKDVTIDGGLSHVQVSVSERSEHFSVEFAAPDGEDLEDREYTEADGGYYGAPGAAGINLSSGDEECGTGSGRFIIKDIHTDAAGEVDRLWALYEERCEAGEPAVFGEVRFGEPLTGAPEVVEPAAIDWPATAVDATGAEVPLAVLAGEAGAQVAKVAITGQDPEDFTVAGDSCTGTELPAGARCEIEVAVRPTAEGPRTAQLVVTDTSGATTSVPLSVNDLEERSPPLPRDDWATMVGEKCFGACFPFDRLFDALDAVSAEGSRERVAVNMAGPGEYFHLTLLAPAGKHLEAREYPAAKVTGFESQEQGVPEMLLSYEGGSCEWGSGRFTIQDIHIGADGEPDRLRALYEIECDYRPILFGEVQIDEPETTAPEVIIPGAVQWPDTPVGATADTVPVTVAARQNGAEVSSVAIEGADAGDFKVSEDNCLDRPLALDARCQIAVGATPTESGTRSAQLLVKDQSGATTTIPLGVSS